MNVRKTIFAVIAIAVAVLAMPMLTAAQAPVIIEVFERPDCSHCQAEKAFLNALLERRSDVVVNFFDITDPVQKERWIKVTELEKLPKVTPVTLIGETVVQGFADEQTTGKYLEDLVDSRIGKENLTFDQLIAAGGRGNVKTYDAGCDADSKTCALGSSAVPLIVKAPFIGAINVSAFSLPALASVLGFIDGFNPCAMWVLVTFLILLAQAGSRRRMWQMAGLFVIAESIMYYLILNVWFTAWDFVGLDYIVTPIIGLVAIGGGVFFLYEGWKSDGTCKVTDLETRAKTMTKIKNLITQPFTFFSVLGIIALALSVNIIEFACSIGIPQTFTKILDLNNLGFLSRQGLMALYIIFYMIDDFIVFGIALYSFEKIGLTTKYSKWSNLVGGVLMLILGLILIFKRSWLVF